jgi:hypothetical protein
MYGRPTVTRPRGPRGSDVNDDEFATLAEREREFALRWARMTAEEQERFCRGLLAAIEVLQRLRVLDGPEPPTDALPA